MTPEVSQWVAYWPVPFTQEMADKRIAAALKAASDGNMLPYCAIEKSSGDTIGWVMFSRDNEDKRRASFGYWLGTAYHGKGYMRELAPIAMAHAFTALDVDIIEAAAKPDNAASISILRACGMKFTGERMLYAPARAREELCRFYEVQKSPSQTN